MKLKNLVKVCSKERSRGALQNVNVRKPDDGSTVCEATDGHILVRITYAKGEGPCEMAVLAAGQYTPDDWADLVCKARPAIPVVDALPFPDTTQVIPAETSATAITAIGIDLALIIKLASILDVGGAKLMFTSNIGPIRIAHDEPGEGSLVAVIMPWRIQ